MKISDIRRDGGMQPRAKMDLGLVAEYAESIRDGAKFPPVVVFFDGTDHWLADGFHRIAAAVKMCFAAVEAYVHQGTQRDAILYACSANAIHGMRRTIKDKHRAVMRLLKDGEWSQWSDREIARQTKTHHVFVGKLRKELSGDNTGYETSTKRKVKRGGTVYTQNTEKIGKRRKPDPQKATPAAEKKAEGFDPFATPDEVGKGAPPGAGKEAPARPGPNGKDLPRAGRGGEYSPRVLLARTRRIIEGALDGASREVRHQVINELIKYLRGLSIELNREASA